MVIIILPPMSIDERNSNVTNTRSEACEEDDGRSTSSQVAFILNEEGVAEMEIIFHFHFVLPFALTFTFTFAFCHKRNAIPSIPTHRCSNKFRRTA
jgi:hypothetical protein